jgi:hypothetical protein
MSKLEGVEYGAVLYILFVFFFTLKSRKGIIFVELKNKTVSIKTLLALIHSKT